MPADKDSSLPNEHELPWSMHWAYLEILASPEKTDKHSSLLHLKIADTWVQTGAYP